MNIIQIARGYSVKKTDGNYGSYDAHCSLTAELGPEDDIQEVSQALFMICKKEVEQSLMNQMVEKQGSPKGVGYASGGNLKQSFDWKNTRAGEEYLERKAEIDNNFGEENGPRGSKFEG